MQRRHRLGSASLIRRVYATGVRVRSKSATVTGLIDGDGPPRIAVVASRRVGGSVVRNRARRRLRAAIGPCLPSMRPGTVAVVAATPDTATLDFQKLVDEVASGAAKAGLVTPSDA